MIELFKPQPHMQSVGRRPTVDHPGRNAYRLTSQTQLCLDRLPNLERNVSGIHGQRQATSPQSEIRDLTFESCRPGDCPAWQIH